MRISRQIVIELAVQRRATESCFDRLNVMTVIRQVWRNKYTLEVARAK